MERSFVKEVEKLRLGAGDTFRGEGILAITKALLQSGVSYVGGYQGAPISHLMDVLSDAKPLLDELGVHFEASANEAAAAAMCAASVHYPMRGAVVWKSTVGTNVASDPLSNLSSVGVTGGVVIILGEDYGEGASIIQERSHAFAMKSQMWLLDPRPHQPKMVEMVERAFELSEASETPVMVEFRIRACHVHGSFETKDNIAPAVSRNKPIQQPRFDYGRVVLPPSNYRQEQKKVKERLPAAIDYIRRNGLNETFGPEKHKLGIVLQGGLYNSLLRGLEQMGLADIFGQSDIPLYVLNVTYPLVPAEIEEFASGKSALLVVEEGQPAYLETAIGAVLRDAGSKTKVLGKGCFPQAGEYTREVMLTGLERFFSGEQAALGKKEPVFGAPERIGALREKAQAALGDPMPVRPPGFCTGCPERPVFSAIKLLQEELGDFHVSADIGCHSACTLPPFNMGSTIVGYGLGLSSAGAVSSALNKRTIAVMGDGGLWHNGLTSGVANAVFNGTDVVLVIFANGYTSATGQQFIPSTASDTGKERSVAKPPTPMTIRGALTGMGVDWIRTANPYDVEAMRAALREAMTSSYKGLKVVLSEAECQLARQRRIKPQTARDIAAGNRVARTRFVIDPDICTGDRACIRASGCPSLTIRESADPLRTEPVTAIDESCVGCGLCGEMAHAAALCPSFSRVETVVNAGPMEKAMARLRGLVTGAAA
jgi:indolepyruvate ferredoxin oxidoreductase alpha subunit